MANRGWSHRVQARVRIVKDDRDSDRLPAGGSTETVHPAQPPQSGHVQMIEFAEHQDGPVRSPTSG